VILDGHTRTVAFVEQGQVRTVREWRKLLGVVLAVLFIGFINALSFIQPESTKHWRMNLRYSTVYTIQKSQVCVYHLSLLARQKC